eukprot:13035398-Alexandrium_andersonii.AAC.1
METAPAASLPTSTCAKNLIAVPAGSGGAPSVGGRARQPSAGSTDVRPARTRAGRVRPGSPARRGHP